MPNFPANVEVRPATAEEMPSVIAQAARQLGMSTDFFGGMSPEWTTCVFVDGEVATTYGAWPLQIRFNGPAVPIQGVTWVSTHPAHRRRGYLRAVVRHHFEQMRERREAAIAALHPAWMAIYGRYGYASITTRTTYTVAPRDIQWRHPVEVPGRVREVDLETEFGLLVDVYRRYREERNALIHRGWAMWDAGPIGKPPPGHHRVVLAYEEDGEALGYVSYHHGPGLERDRAGASHYLQVTDYFAMTPAAHQALWSILGGYDNVAEIRRPNAGPDDPLPNMLVEPRMLNAKTADGIMARLVNVEDALPSGPTPSLPSSPSTSSTHCASGTPASGVSPPRSLRAAARRSATTGRSTSASAWTHSPSSSSGGCQRLRPLRPACWRASATPRSSYGGMQHCAPSTRPTSPSTPGSGPGRQAAWPRSVTLVVCARTVNDQSTARSGGNTSMPLVLGVTGSIATGKSYLCQYMVEKYGAIHADADKVVHRMYDPGKPGFDRIVAEFGEEVIGEDGYIDRKKIGQQVFGKPERMRDLTRAIGDISGEMKRVIDEWRATLKDDDIAILEAVNLIEAQYSAWTDATWLVGADYDVALPRLMQRNNFSEEEARQRLDAARTWQQREPGSDRLFMNNGTLEDLEASVDRAIEETMAMFKAGTLPRSRWHAWWESAAAEREAGTQAPKEKADAEKQT